MLKNSSVSFDVLLGDYLLAVLDKINYITVMFLICAYLTNIHHFTHPKVDKLIPKLFPRLIWTKKGQVLSHLV